MSSPTDVAAVRQVIASPALGSNRFAGRFPARRAPLPMDNPAPMPEPTARRMFDTCTPRLSFAAITQDLGMDPSTEMVWQQFLRELLPAATTEVGVRQPLVQRMREAKLDGPLQKALLNRALSYYRNRVQKSARPTFTLRKSEPVYVRCAKSILDAIDAGNGSLAAGDVGPLMDQYGIPIVDETLQALIGDCQVSFDGFRFTALAGGADEADDWAEKAAPMAQPATAHPGGGPGSRGGSVIGRTASGKPIYTNHPAGAASYTHADHADAAAAHGNFVHLTEGDKQKHHQHMAGYHAARAEATAKGKAEKSMKLVATLIKAGEGSRGGRVLGHTKSGKPIYENSGGAGNKFTAKDHEEAAAAHQRESMMHYQIASNHPEGSAKHNAAVSAAGKHNLARMNHRDEATAITRRGVNTIHARNAKVLKRSDPENNHHTEKSMNLVATLSKAEGDHGGHIIGHTQSGKPIYASSHGSNAGALSAKSAPSAAKQAKDSHADFSAQDHRDAAKAHTDAAMGARNNIQDTSSKLASQGHSMQQILSHPDIQAHNKSAIDHETLSEAHTRAAKTVKKSMTTMKSLAAQELSDALEKGKSGGLPTIDQPTARQLTDNPDANGGPLAGSPQGGSNDSGGPDWKAGVPASATTSTPNAGDAQGAGSSDDGDWQEGVPDVPTIKDWHEVPKLKERASTAKSRQDVIDGHAPMLRAQAQRSQTLARGGHDVQVGHGRAGDMARKSAAPAPAIARQTSLVTEVRGGMDERASRFAKGGSFYQGMAPKLAQNHGTLHKATLCKSCDNPHPAYYTSCPACGDGGVLQRSTRDWGSSGRVVGQPEPCGGGLAPMHKSDVYSPVVKLSDD